MNAARASALAVLLAVAAPLPLHAAGSADVQPAAEKVDPSRFGMHPADRAYGAYQRGLFITALNLAKPLAENGDPAAQTLVAEIYARGLGVPRNDELAAKWYVAAAAQGVPEAQFQYALLLLDGTHVAKNAEMAVDLMGKAAVAGNRLAQFNYAQMLLERMPGDRGLTEAAPWFERAARQNLPDAQYAMAQFYAQGAGGKPRDEEIARTWLERAAAGGYDTAQLDLGTWLVEGRGGERKPEIGFAWLRTAAIGGNVAAQNRVAKLYRLGIGTEGDSIEAAAWYILARRAGLYDREMNIFLDGLTAEQQKQAIERANRLR